MRYTPRSDFRVSIGTFPHIVLEVNSQANGSDEFCMLLQASCLARIGNWLRAPTHNKPVVIMAIYIDKDFKAHQHILCQPNVRSIEVEYVTTTFDLNVPRAAFEFIFQLYNFFSVAQNDNYHMIRPGPRLAEAKKSVGRRDYRTFHSKRRYEEDQGKSSKKKSKRYPDTSAQGGEEDCLGNPSVQRKVSRAGYTLTQIPQISKEFTPLTPLKTTLRRATTQSGVLVVLKLLTPTNVDCCTI